MNGYLYNKRKFLIKENNDYSILENIENLEFLYYDYDDFLDINEAVNFFNRIPNTVKYIVIEISNFTSYLDIIHRHKETYKDYETDEKMLKEIENINNNFNKMFDNLPPSLEYIFLNYYELYNIKRLPFNCKLSDQKNENYFKIMSQVKFY